MFRLFCISESTRWKYQSHQNTRWRLKSTIVPEIGRPDCRTSGDEVYCSFRFPVQSCQSKRVRPSFVRTFLYCLLYSFRAYSKYLNKFAKIPDRKKVAGPLLTDYKSEVSIDVGKILHAATTLTLMADKGSDKAKDTGMNVLLITNNVQPIFIGTCHFGLFSKNCFVL